MGCWGRGLSARAGSSLSRSSVEGGGVAETAERHAAIYVRVSTRHQAEEGFSLEDQRDKLMAYANQRGWSVELFEDAGVSGEKLDERPGLGRLLRGVDEGRFNVVLVVDESRLARDELVAALIRDRLKRAGVLAATLSGERDLTDPSDNFVANILGAAHAFEQDLRTAKMIAGHRATAQAGYWTGGPTPFGFRTVEDGSHVRLAIDPRESDIIRAAVKLIVDQGCSTQEAAQRLNALGLPPRRASSWRAHNLRRTLRAETLAGRWRWGKQTSRNPEPVTVTIPAILDEERWQALQAALDAKAIPHKTKHHFYLLSGRLYGRCGGHYYGIYRKDRDVRQYRCWFKTAPPHCGDRLVHADPIEAGVWGEVCALLGDPNRLMTMAADYLKLRTTQGQVEGDQLTALTRRVANLDRAITSAAAEALKAGLTGSQIAATLGQLQEEREALERHRTQLAAGAEHAGAASQRKRRLWQLAETARRRLHTLTPLQQRQVLDLLDVRVFILKDATRRDPTLIRLEGTVHDTSLDAFESREGPKRGASTPDTSPKRLTAALVAS